MFASRNTGSYLPRIVVGALVLVLFVFLAAGAISYENRLRYEQAAHANVRNLSLLLERDISAELDRINLTLHAVVEEVERELARGRISEARINAYLAQQQAHLPEIVSLRMTDEHGIVRYGRGVGTEVTDLSDRDYFIRQRGNPSAGLVISAPVMARIDKQWVIPVSRRLNRPDGDFAGIVYAILPVARLVQKFAELDLGALGLVTLRSATHVSMARYPEVQEGSGALGQVGVSDQLRKLLRDDPVSVTYVAPSPSDRVERVSGYTRLKSYPLYVVVGLSPKDYLRAWGRDTLQTFAIVLLFAFVTAWLVWQLGRAWRRQEDDAQRWGLALEGGELAVWDWDLSTGRVTLSHPGKALFGYTEDEIGNQVASWTSLYHPADVALLTSRMKGHFRARSALFDAEFRVRCKDGSWKWVHSRGKVVRRASDGRPLRMIGTLVDVSERRQREEQLKLSSAVFHLASEAMVITSAENNIISVNPAFTRITGYAPHEVIGRNPRILSAKTHSRTFYEEMWRSLNETNIWSGEVLNRKKSGEVYVEWLSLRRVLDEEGRLTNYIAVFSDISERKAAEARIQHLALHDALTDLPNRTLLNERLEQALVRSQRDRTHVGLIYFDLDKFKPVNDTYGHQVGDDLLQQVARRALACVRASDTVARIGGDEFVVLLPTVEGSKDAVRVAEKIRLQLAQPFTVGGHQLEIGSSLGVAIHPDHGSDAEALTHSADTAMYRAKQGGRNRVVLAGEPA